MSDGRLPPSSNAFSVGQQQPYINHGGVNHFQSSQNHGAFVQPEKKGVGQETQRTPVNNIQAQSVTQEMNPALRGKEIRSDRLGNRKMSSSIPKIDVNFCPRFGHFLVPFNLQREAGFRLFLKQHLSCIV